jgi:gliding motility-associated-like protein
MKFSALLTYLFLCFSYSSTAQVCNGSLGDPVVNETFGAGGGYQIPSYKTSYTAVGGCPDNAGGTYTLASFLFGCGPNSWVQMIGDHTRDMDGNYMLVNASNKPGTVYTDTAKNLCGNTQYQFGIWFTSVMTKLACDGQAILPNLHFQVKTVSGTVLVEGNSGFLPIVEDREWKFYSLSFQTPSTVRDVIFSISVDPRPGCGSAFAIDDITIRPCSPSVITATINGSPDAVDVCANYTDNWTLNATYTPGFANPEFQWQNSIDNGQLWVDIPGATTMNYNVPHRDSGVVLYRICIAENGNINSLSCRVASNVVHTGVYPVPPPHPTLTLIGCIGKDFHFPDPDPYDLQVLYTGPNGYSSTSIHAIIPNVQYNDSGLYTLKNTLTYGCVLLDTIYLKVFPGAILTTQPVAPLCEGTTEQLSASASDSVTWQWTPALGLSSDVVPNPIASPSKTTEYKVLITNKYGCKDSAYLTIFVDQKPVADAGPDKKINLGDSVVLNGSVSGTSINFSWSPASFIDDIHSKTPTVYPPEDAEYTLTVNSEVGCGSSSSSVIVKVYKDVYVPTGFTPNNDGKNDLFRVTAADNYKRFKLLVCNRWGQVIFETTDINKGWNGKFKDVQLASDVYVYYLEIVTASNRKVTKKGTITLIR